MKKKNSDVILRKLSKFCDTLVDLMQNYQAEEISEVILTRLHPDDVAVIAIFVANMQTQFTKKLIDVVYKLDNECSSCDNADCQDRKE